MTARSVPAPCASALQRLQQTFVADILPRVETHGRVYFRHVRCVHQEEELLSEMDRQRRARYGRAQNVAATNPEVESDAGQTD